MTKIQMTGNIVKSISFLKKDTLFKNATLSEVTQIFREAKWNRDFGNIVKKEFLGSCYGGRTFKLLRHEANMMLIMLENFLTYRGYKAIDAIGTYSELDIPTFDRIEIAPDEYKNIFSEGVAFIEKTKKDRKIIEIYCSNRYVSITILDCVNDDFLEEWKKYSIENSIYKGAKIAANLNFIKLDKKYIWDELIISDYKKKTIRRFLESYKYSDLCIKNKLNMKKGLLLHGEPGSGKSLCIKIIYSTSPHTVILVSPEWFDDTSKVSYTCQMARDLAPSILVLEDIDLYAEDRTSEQHNQILGALMNELDGVITNNNVMVIGTTNKLEYVEKAIKNRPGRFDRLIEFASPTDKERAEIFKINLPEKFHNLINAAIIQATDKLTGAHCFEIIQNAKLLAIECNSLDENNDAILTEKIFKKAIAESKGKDFSPQRREGAGFGMALGKGALFCGDEMILE